MESSSSETEFALAGHLALLIDGVFCLPPKHLPIPAQFATIVHELVRDGTASKRECGPAVIDAVARLRAAALCSLTSAVPWLRACQSRRQPQALLPDFAPYLVNAVHPTVTGCNSSSSSVVVIVRAIRDLSLACLSAPPCRHWPVPRQMLRQALASGRLMQIVLH